MALFNRLAGDVLGLNARAIEYTQKARRSTGAKVANNKLATKRMLQKAGIPTPRLFAKITSRQELSRFRWTKLPASFVLKPKGGSGGGGIVVVYGLNKKGNWVKADKTQVLIPTLRKHVMNILDGGFSSKNAPDTAFFEQRVKIASALKPYSVRGVPDVRVLVYNGVPVMAELRLPTEESLGRSNLHVGGIGVGIDIVHGYTTTAIHHGRLIETLPGTRLELSGIKVPHWNEVLLLAVRAARATNLTFAGVDIAIDREDGPLVLEINARPGLEIQLANMSPLKGRLRRVEGLTVKSPDKGVAVAKSLFGEDLEQEIEDLSGRTILGIEEKIQIIDADGQPHSLLAKIDTGAYRSAIDASLARKYKLDRPVVGHKKVRAALGQETRPIVDISLTVRDRLVKSKAYITDRTKMNYDAIIGRRDLKGFLVDPAKRPSKPEVG